MKTNKIFFFWNGRRAQAMLSAVGLGLLVFILFLSTWSGNRYQESSQWREHSDQVLAQMRNVRLALAMAESSERGAVIAGRPEFLEPFYESVKLVKQHQQKLQEMVADNPTQVERLAVILPLIDEKLRFLDEVGQTSIQPGGRIKAMDLVGTGHGRRLMEKIQQKFGQMEDEETLLLKLRTDRSTDDYRKMSFVVLFGLILAFVFLLASTLFLRHEIQLRERTQEDLVRANLKALEASSLKSSFLANMSHEIRTPLNGIIGMSRMLEMTKMDEKQKDFVETIKVSSNALLALINEILDLSKIESGKLQLEEAHFELGSLLRSTISIVEFAAQSKNLQMSLVVGAGVPDYFVGDPLRLRQVLLNLLNNSIKFSEHGTIHLKVNKVREGDSTVWLRFEIIDQGIGVDIETKQKLFNAFTQGDDSTSRKYGGTGLGLAISKQIIEMMGGVIDVESVKGVGSRFFFELELKSAKYEEMSRPVTLDSMTAKKLTGRILIAEDNRTNQKVVTEMMTLLGCEVRVVENGQLALEALRQEQNFDLILMDGQMPVMDGYEATKRLRSGEAGEHHRKIPVIATTANAIKGDVEKCFEAGMNDYIGKPISYDDLAIKVEKWLKRGKNLIDESALASLEKLSEKSKKNLLEELVQVFAEDTVQIVNQMKTAISEGKPAELSRLAHILKSSSANLGVWRLRDLSLWLEKSAAESTSKQQLITVESIGREFEEALPLLKEKAEQAERKLRG